MEQVKGEGVFNYQIVNGLYRLVVDVDASIVDYYRALLPKSVQLNRQKYAPHISVVRENRIPAWKQGYWDRYNKMDFVFDYSVEVQHDHTYYWLEVFSDRLGAVREELGLRRGCWYTWPPNGKDCFHITIGNTKAV